MTAATRRPVKDCYGVEHEVVAQINTDGTRIVIYDADSFTPEDAREIARRFLAAADALDGSLVLFPGGAE